MQCWDWGLPASRGLAVQAAVEVAAVAVSPRSEWQVAEAMIYVQQRFLTRGVSEKDCVIH